jgi:NitT/TauT family transport system substrate-binding protein
MRSGATTRPQRAGVGWGALALVALAVAACGVPGGGPAAPSAAPSKPPGVTGAPGGSTPPTGGSEGGAGRAAPAPVAEAIRVAIPGQSFGFLPLSVALHRGLFKEEGLDPVEVTAVGGDLQPVALQAGEVDYAGAGGTIGRAAVQGLPVKVILFLYERPTWSLVAQPDVTSAAQLRGKRIGVTRIGTSNDMGAKMAAAHLGLNPESDVSTVSIGVQALQGLVGGAVEAAMLNTDATAIAQAQGYHELVPMADVAVWPFSGFGVADSKLAQQRGQVKRYARAQIRGLQFMLDHPADVAQMAVAEFGMEPEGARLAVTSALRSVSRENPGGVSGEGIARYVETELRPGLPAGTEVQPAQFLDLSIVEEAQRELGIGR